MALSTALANALYDHIHRNIAYTSPTTLYVGLYTSDPAVDDSGTEVSGGSYARQAITFAAPVGGAGANDALVTFPTATAPWGTVTHYALFDEATGHGGVPGTMLEFAPLTTSYTIDTGMTPDIQISALTSQLA